MKNEIYLRRRGKVIVPAGTASEPLSLNYVASIMKNVEALGYTFSQPMAQALQGLTLEELTAFYGELIPMLRKMRGAHRAFKPMYPNFPKQVMEASELELFLNAMVHYWSDGQLLPHYEKEERLPLAEEVKLTVIDLGNETEFQALFGQIVGSNTSLSDQDKADIDWYLLEYGTEVGAMMPASIPQKETQSYIAALFINYFQAPVAGEFLARYFATATDVLRLAVALSEGDISLAKPTRFRNFKRSERDVLMSLLENTGNPTEDMIRWKKRWIRLGEKLHAGEYAKKYPKAVAAFGVLRNNEKYTTFNNAVEQALLNRKVREALDRLVTRPGDFARRLDHLLRITPTTERQNVVAAFQIAAVKVSTPVLLQVRQHFVRRNDQSDIRVFFPKGNIAKAKAIDNQLPPISKTICKAVVEACDQALTQRFAEKAPLGKVFVDEKLQDYLLPFSQRSASKSLRTLVRGSKVSLPENCDVLRFFIWWMNGNYRTDIDLSATLFNDKFENAGVLSYYNLREFGGCHSGDIVDAPNGASEFIDVSLSKLQKAGIRYVVMTLNSFTSQPFCDLPECFAGWMARQHAQSGEVFEPKTVQDRLDVTANTQIAVPLVIDVMERKVIWCDLSLKRNDLAYNNVRGNMSGIHATLRSMVEISKPNVYDLLKLHASARGELVSTPEEADVVFSVENETPLRLEEIASEYMA
jgi:hypothetical protein